MSPSFNSFGSLPSISQLLWDTDLIIPEGKAIESANGEVAISGDVSITGNLSTEGGMSSGGNVTATENLVGVNAVLSDKPLVFGENVGNASVTLEQLPTDKSSYTSPDYTITGAADNVQYILPPISVRASGSLTFNIDGRHANGTYTTLAQLQFRGYATQTTPPTLLPIDCRAIRISRTSLGSSESMTISSDLTLSLTPQPIY